MSAPPPQATGRADLHTHTTASDGALAPAELVARAAAGGVRTMAVTDHDTMAGVAEAQRAGGELGLRVICGVELSAAAPSGSLHLLGYFPAAPPAPMVAALERMADARRGRAERILARLAELGAPVAMERVLARAGGTIGRPHIADALVEAGHARDRQEAFDRLLHDGGPAWVDHRNLTPEAAVRLVRDHGGAPVVAHPGSLRLGRRQLRSFMAGLAARGLIGIEVHRPEHTAEQRQQYHDVGRALGLIPAGGSDFHRPDGSVEIGQTGLPPLPEGTIDRLLERAAAEAPSA